MKLGKECCSSASLASPPDDPLPQALPDSHFLHSTLRLICCEEIDGRRWKYVAESDGSGKVKRNSVRAISLESPQSPFDEVGLFLRSYVVPQGFPASVNESYVPYMKFRALKHFFGGAMATGTSLIQTCGVQCTNAHMVKTTSSKLAMILMYALAGLLSGLGIKMEK